MASSMWSALEQAQAVGVGGVSAGGGGAIASTFSSDSAWLHSLGSALNVAGDAEFWEESISPAAIRSSLSTADPSNPSHASTILRGMKWLLANMSKGRDVSDYYPHVVKLVQATSLEARKLVYLYLVQYADYSDATRELSLLSINSFQRGLGDPEQWIRGLALRVLTSIRLQDILQIQILAAQRSSADSSPYVRKCAATALVKLHRASHDESQKRMVIELLVELLEREESTMVLTSALIAFSELHVDLQYLHTSFRKICHLLTDMDEWGQVVVLDLMARYARTYFRQPPEGEAAKIDRERRIVQHANDAHDGTGAPPEPTTTSTSSSTALLLPPRPQPPASAAVAKVKRRVVRKGFYSDEEDSSTDEEGYENPMGQLVPSISQALREQPVDGSATTAPHSGSSSLAPLGSASASAVAAEMDTLAPDHRLLLSSAMPLLKSRNAGVVLAVCALSYYCGIASIPARVSVGKALVRISRDKREIQYVVLTSIRTLAAECPSAFTPYLSDFFITAMDPEFTKLIKLDILTLLALEPTAIDRVLAELRAYVGSSASEQPSFAVAAIRGVGRVAEMARRVHDRHGHKHKKWDAERQQANATALNCLFGLVTLSQVATDKPLIVGECVLVMQRILQMLNSDGVSVDDPNGVRAKALKRILLLVVGSLTSRAFVPQPQDGDNDDEENDENESSNDLKSRLTKATTKDLPADAVASGLWILGEFLSLPTFEPSPVAVLGGDRNRVTAIRTELIRWVARAFPDLHTSEKEQGVHMASKFLLSMAGSGSEAAACENVLAMGRLDSHPDLRDRARFESGLIHVSLGLRHDTDGLDSLPPTLTRKLSVDQVKQILLRRKLASSSLPSGSGSSSESFRFGTLSSLVGHRARSAYVPLPPWADKDSPSSLRDPPEKKVDPAASRAPKAGPASKGGRFYDASSSSSDNSRDDKSSSSSSSSDESNDSESSTSSDESSNDESSSSSADLLQLPQSTPAAMPPAATVAAASSTPSVQRRTILPRTVVNEESDDSVASSSSDEDDEDDNSSDSSPLLAALTSAPAANPSLISLGGGGSGTLLGTISSGQASASAPSLSVSDDLKGLVLSPVAVSAAASVNLESADVDLDSSAWRQMVRPDLAGGLSVSARYVRGATRRREALSMGWAVLDSAPAPNVVCLQFRFENQKKDSMSFRRLRLQQRSSATSSASSSSVIGPRKVVTPPEIPQLSPGQKVDCFVGIEFAGISDRDGSLIAKFDVQFGTGSVPIEIKPNVGDLLQPPPSHRGVLSADEFDAAVRQLHGFQRIESKFDASDSESAATLSRKVVENVAVVPVGGAARPDKEPLQLRFVGHLPSAGDPVYVALTRTTVDNDPQGKVVVCCLQPLAVNSIMNQVKRALSS